MTPTLPASQQTLDILHNPAALAQANPDELADAIDRRNALMDKIRDAALKSTRSEQWADMDGKPWPTAPAAETIARRCAVKVHGTRYLREERHDDEGDFYFYVYTATVELPGGLDSAEVVGTCSSRDQFIGTNTSTGRELSEINEDDILKAAYSNLIVNGVMRLCALRGLTWDFLKIYGIDPEKAQKITHRSGAKGGGKGQTSTDVEIKFGKCTGKMLSDLADEDFRWYVGRWEADLADPAKEKYHRFCKQNLEIAKAILAKRANEKAGTTTTNGNGQPSIWQRIRALDQAIPMEELKQIVKVATGRTNANELVEADIEKVKAEIAKRAKGEDVPF